MIDMHEETYFSHMQTEYSVDQTCFPSYQYEMILDSWQKKIKNYTICPISLERELLCKNRLVHDHYEHVVPWLLLLSKALWGGCSKMDHRYHRRSKICFQVKNNARISTTYKWTQNHFNQLCKCANLKFDVTMGSFDGAETCQLVGLYLLSQL